MYEDCEKLLKEGNKHSSFLRREYYTAAISFIHAAECFLEKKEFEEAFAAALRAIESLEKTRKLDVSDEFERAFEIAYYAAENLEEEKYNSVRDAFFSFLLNSARDLELTKDFADAARKYEKAARIADESKRKQVLGKAAECLEKVAETKIKVGKKQTAIKLLKHAKKLLREIGDQTSIKEIDLKLQELGAIPVETEAQPTLNLKKEVFEGIASLREEVSRKVEKAIKKLRETLKTEERKEIKRKTLKIEEEPTLIEKIRKKGKFFDKLSYAILQILKEECPKHGGIITLSEITLLINQQRTEKPLPTDIILTAIKQLEKKGLIPRIETLSSGVKIIPFIELTEDNKEILNIAFEKGWTTIEEIVIKTGWSKEKALLTLKSMEENGIAIRQTTIDKGTRWFFPALYKNSKIRANNHHDTTQIKYH